MASICIQSNIVGVGDGVGNDGEVCLICNNSSSGFGRSLPTSIVFDPTSPPAFSKDLDVYFLLRHVLELPSEQLESYLRHCPNVKDWVKICEDCSENHVEKCKRRFLELLEVKKRFKEAKLGLIGAIKNSFDVEQQDLNAPQDQQFILDICKETRQFVAQGQDEYYGNNMETSPLSCNVPPTPATKSFGARKGRLARGIKNSNSKPKKQSSSSITISHQLAAINKNEDTQPVEEETLYKDSAFKVEPKSSPSCNEDDDGGLGTELEEEKANYLDASLAAISNEDINEDKDEEEIKVLEIPEESDTTSEPFKQQRILKQKRRVKRGTEGLPNATFSCSLCQEAFASSLKLRIHQMSIHKTNIFHCNECEFQTTAQSYLNKHIRRRHVEEKDLPSDLRCSQCQKVYTTKYRLANHIKNSHSQNAQKRKEFYCKACDKTFCGTINYFTHLGNRHGKKSYLRYSCSIENCGKSFYNEYLLKRHEVVHQAPEHKCDQCGKEFRLKQMLGRHFVQQHENVVTRPFLCEQCPKRFKSKEYLHAHTRNVHTPNVQRPKAPKLEKSGPCPTCGAIFSSHYVLQQHISSVHEDKGPVMTCELCGKTLKSRNSYSMKLHMFKAHNIGTLGPASIQEFSCTVEGCGKKFNLKAVLKKHVLTVHEKVCPFECKECGKAFGSRDGLKIHVQGIHTNRETKPFKCDVCGKGFAVERYMKFHKRKRHNKEKAEVK